ncbi:NUDIX domain-containing protein [Patescibacteria group bacterium]
MTEYCADIIATYKEKFVIIKRLSFPEGLALPGGRKEQGEKFEQCAHREFQEETGLSLLIEKTLGIYDDPDRDPRGRKISTVFIGKANGETQNETGKTQVLLMTKEEVLARKEEFVFDHYQIFCDSLEDN